MKSVADRLAEMGLPDPLDAVRKVVSDLPGQIAEAEAEGRTNDALDLRAMLAQCEKQLRQYGRETK